MPLHYWRTKGLYVNYMGFKHRKFRIKAAFTAPWIIQHAAMFLVENVPDFLLIHWNRFWLSIYIASFEGERSICANVLFCTEVCLLSAEGS
jgi:hypothetical protein